MAEPRQPSDDSPLASFVPPLRWIGNIICLFGVLLLGGLAWLALSGSTEADIATFIVPALFIALGLALRSAARRLADAAALDLPALGGTVFMGTGGLMAAGGLAMAFDDPAGFALTGFGLVFVGAGYLARRLFAAPEGKKAIAVSGYEAPLQNYDGTRGRRRQSTIIYVDEQATPAEVDAARRAWRENAWQERPDWVSGRILGEDQRTGPMLYWGAGIWTFIALLAVLGATLWDGGFWLGALPASFIALVLLVAAVRLAVRRRKFADSALVMERCPAILGGCLRGEVQTGLRQRGGAQGDFTLVLSCVHRWEETDFRGTNSTRRSYRRRKTLWEARQRAAAHAYEREGQVDSYLAVPVDFDLPQDRPETTLGGSNEGIRWELAVSTKVPRVDYSATFILPVLAATDPAPADSSE